MTPLFATLTTLALQQPTPSTMTAAGPADGASGGPAWLLAVNLVIWTGLFLFLLRLERRLAAGSPKERER